MFVLTNIPDLRNQLKETSENCAEKIKILEVSLTIMLLHLYLVWNLQLLLTTYNSVFTSAQYYASKTYSI
jgi:hypothetical protein